MSKASLKSIAEVLGISQATVSNALNGKGRVGEKLKLQILELANQYGYSPSIHARVLHGHRLNILGLIISDMGDGVGQDILNGAETAASKRGYHLIVSTTRGETNKSLLAVEQYEKLKIAGVLHLPTHPQEASAIVELCDQLELPLSVLYRRAGIEKSRGLFINHLKGYTQAVNHLLDIGHRKIALIHEGQFEHSDIGMTMESVESLVKRADGSVVAAKLMNIKELIDQDFRGFACDSDNIAIKTLKILKSAGLKIPQEAGVVGYRDSKLASVCDPSLTTVRVPFNRLGADSTNQLIDRIENGYQEPAGDSESDVLYELNTDLVVRQSTKS